MENIIVALSNFPSIYPIYLSLHFNDFYTFASLAFVSFWSIVSHLLENHKHGMPGLGNSKKISYLTNRLDVLGCGLIISRICYLYYYKYGHSINPVIENKYLVIGLLMPIILLQISEYDKYNSKRKCVYIIFHSMWHITAFYSLGIFLKSFIY
jgi:hypothetical protein